MTVIDCSASCAWFIPDEASESAERLLKDILDQKIHMIVPELWWTECINVIRNAIIRKRLEETDAQKVLFFLKEIPKTIVPSEQLGLSGILKTSIDEKLSAYDATYFHLAVTTGSELITLDTDILSLKGKYQWIQSLINYP